MTLPEFLAAIRKRCDDNGMCCMTCECGPHPKDDLRKSVEVIEILRKALEEQVFWWNHLPSGIDEEADENNSSPEDAAAHIGGLAVKKAKNAFVDAEKVVEARPDETRR